MKITNNLNLPAPFVDACSSEHTYTPKRYSVTQILKGVPEAVLERRHADEIEADCSDMVWAIFGSAVHSILEKSQETNTQIKENKLIVDVHNGYQLSGIFDLYDDKTGTVTDYKTASVWKAIKGDWDDYRRQTLIYCWMLNKIGFKANRGEIVALLKDHSKSKARFDASYPQHPVVTVSWDFTDEELAEVELWIYSRFAQIQVAEQLPDNLMPECTDAERWADPEKYVVIKKGTKRAKRVLSNQEEAEKLRTELGDDYIIEVRPAQYRKCEAYCSACKFCKFWQSQFGEKDD